MANIIDEFVVSLGLDPRQYNDEIKKYREGVKRDRQEAESASKDDAIYRRRAAEGIRQVRNEVVSLGLAFAGANSVKGFITEILTGDASTARLADNIGVTASRIKAVEEVIRTVGGSAQEARGTVSGLFDTFQAYQLGDNSKGGWLGALGMTANDLKDPIAGLEKMADARDRLHMDNGEFRAKARGIGVDDDTINAMEMGGKAFRELIAQKERDAKFSKDDGDAAKDLQKKLADLVTQLTGGTRPALYQIVDALNKVGDTAQYVNGIIGFLSNSLKGLMSISDIISAIGLKADMAYSNGRAALAGRANPKMQQYYLERAGEDAHALADIADRNDQRFGRGDYAPKSGDDASGIPNYSEDFKRRMGAGFGLGPSGQGGVSGLFSILEKKYGTDRARGIWAGMGAESTWNPNALSPDGGAYGLGQWRGPRLALLRKRYGKKDGTVSAEDQIKFLMWELEGGDKGGSSVLNSTSALDALSNYIGGYGWGFMRPGAGRSGDMNRGQSILGIRAGGRRHSSHRTTHIHVGGVTVHTSDARNIPRDVGRKIGDNVAIINANSGLE